MAEFHGMEFPQMPYALRCACGEKVGIAIAPPDPERTVVRCYRCAAVEEAETITAEADSR